MTIRAPRSRPPLGARLRLGLRFVVLAVPTVAVVTVSAHWVSSLLLAGTLGPTAYAFIAHPASEMSRLRNALIGHSAAILVGMAAVAAWGGWGEHYAATARPGIGQGVAVAVAVAGVLFVLELADAHHTPAAATALLVASGLVAIGRPLAALALSLLVVMLTAALLGKLIPSAHAISRPP